MFEKSFSKTTEKLQNLKYKFTRHYLPKEKYIIEALLKNT